MKWACKITEILPAGVIATHARDGDEVLVPLTEGEARHAAAIGATHVALDGNGNVTWIGVPG